MYKTKNQLSEEKKKETARSTNSERLNKMLQNNEGVSEEIKDNIKNTCKQMKMEIK